MHAKVTKFKMRKGTKEEGMIALEGLRSEIMALPGILMVTTVRNAAREGYVVSVNQSEAQAHANAAKVAALWARFAGFMEAMPSTEDHEVLAHWTK